jgi:hypothetical protein
MYMSDSFSKGTVSAKKTGGQKKNAWFFIVMQSRQFLTEIVETFYTLLNLFCFYSVWAFLLDLGYI